MSEEVVDVETPGIARRVATEEARKFATEKDILFFEISALNG